MAGLDQNFDEAQAKIWKMKVENEFKEVDKVLKAVEEECETAPYEDDTIMKAMHDVGEGIETAWNELEKGFDNVIQTFDNIISTIRKAVEEGLESLQNYVNNFNV